MASLIDEDQQRFEVGDAFQPAFVPIDYLKEYFGTVDDEDLFTARFLTEACNLLPDNLLIHEYGGGPVLTAAISLVTRAREIHFSDYVKASMDELQTWRDARPESFDWGEHIRLALEMEGILPTPEAVSHRESLLRQKMTLLTTCDARSSTPLDGGLSQYDLVSAQHCLDVAANHESEFVQICRNVDTLVRPGGWFLVGVTTGTSVYTVGGIRFSRANLKAEDLSQAFVALGYDVLLFDSFSVPQGREYNGIAMCLGRKPE